MILLIQARTCCSTLSAVSSPMWVRDGGMPPLMIEPIDFMALYQARVAQAQGAVRGAAAAGDGVVF